MESFSPQMKDPRSRLSLNYCDSTAVIRRPQSSRTDPADKPRLESSAPSILCNHDFPGIFASTSRVRGSRLPYYQRPHINLPIPCVFKRCENIIVSTNVSLFSIDISHFNAIYSSTLEYKYPAHFRTQFWAK